jgi:hypothetical protein
LSVTLPNDRFDGLMLSTGSAGFSLIEKVRETPAALAVSVTVRAVGTDDTVAVNPALVSPAATVTVAGSFTAVLLLDKLTLNPPLGAAAVSATVQRSVPAPVMVPELQENALSDAVSAAVPVPLRSIAAVPPVDELLVTMTFPVAAPAIVGSNSTLSVFAAPGFNVVGIVIPEIV